MSRISRAGSLLSSLTAALLSTSMACASQGPGIAPGTASAFTQMAMAIAVYGLSAGIIIVGLIGALKRR